MDSALLKKVLDLDLSCIVTLHDEYQEAPEHGVLQKGLRKMYKVGFRVHEKMYILMSFLVHSTTTTTAATNTT